ncbi:MAG: hypothetical protein GY861_20110, partial [bacterium]|nr:hypothetical protein [bacterium]
MENQVEEKQEKPAGVAGKIVEQTADAVKTAMENQVEEKQEKPAVAGVAGKIVKQTADAVKTVVESQVEEKPEKAAANETRAPPVNRTVVSDKPAEKQSSEQPSDAHIQQHVAEWLPESAGADDKSRQELLADLGRTDNQITEIMANFAVESIAVLIDLINQTGDLANCATEALGNLLDALGITASAEDKENMATIAILVDILMGEVTAESLQKGLSDGTPFETSMFAIQKAAYVNYGIELNANITNYDDLESDINDGNSVIVHVGGDHYIVVTGIEDGVVTYVDVDGNEYTMSAEDFIKWTGNDIKILSELTVGVEMTVHQSIKTMGARGGPLGVVEDIVGGAADIVSGTADIVTDVFDGAADIVTDVWDGAADIVTDVWDGAADIVTDVWDGAVDIATDVWNGAADIVTDVWDGAVEIYNDVTDFVAEAYYFVTEPIMEFVDEYIADIPIVGDIVNFVVDAVNFSFETCFVTLPQTIGMCLEGEWEEAFQYYTMQMGKGLNIELFGIKLGQVVKVVAAVVLTYFGQSWAVPLVSGAITFAMTYEDTYTEVYDMYIEAGYSEEEADEKAREVAMECAGIAAGVTVAIGYATWGLDCLGEGGSQAGSEAAKEMAKEELVGQVVEDQIIDEVVEETIVDQIIDVLLSPVDYLIDVLTEGVMYGLDFITDTILDIAIEESVQSTIEGYVTDFFTGAVTTAYISTLMNISLQLIMTGSVDWSQTLDQAGFAFVTGGVLGLFNSTMTEWSEGASGSLRQGLSKAYVDFAQTYNTAAFKTTQYIVNIAKLIMVASGGGSEEWQMALNYADAEMGFYGSIGSAYDSSNNLNKQIGSGYTGMDRLRDSIKYTTDLYELKASLAGMSGDEVSEADSNMITMGNLLGTTMDVGEGIGDVAGQSLDGAKEYMDTMVDVLGGIAGIGLAVNGLQGDPMNDFLFMLSNITSLYSVASNAYDGAEYYSKDRNKAPTLKTLINILAGLGQINEAVVKITNADTMIQGDYFDTKYEDMFADLEAKFGEDYDMSDPVVGQYLNDTYGEAYMAEFEADLDIYLEFVDLNALIAVGNLPSAAFNLVDRGIDVAVNYRASKLDNDQRVKSEEVTSGVNKMKAELAVRNWGLSMEDVESLDPGAVYQIYKLDQYGRLNETMEMLGLDDINVDNLAIVGEQVAFINGTEEFILINENDACVHQGDGWIQIGGENDTGWQTEQTETGFEVKQNVGMFGDIYGEVIDGRAITISGLNGNLDISVSDVQEMAATVTVGSDMVQTISLDSDYGIEASYSGGDELLEGCMMDVEMQVVPGSSQFIITNGDFVFDGTVDGFYYEMGSGGTESKLADDINTSGIFTFSETSKGNKAYTVSGEEAIVSIRDGQVVLFGEGTEIRGGSTISAGGDNIMLVAEGDLMIIGQDEAGYKYAAKDGAAVTVTGTLEDIEAVQECRLELADAGSASMYKQAGLEEGESISLTVMGYDGLGISSAHTEIHLSEGTDVGEVLDDAKYDGYKMDNEGTIIYNYQVKDHSIVEENGKRKLENAQFIGINATKPVELTSADGGISASVDYKLTTDANGNISTSIDHTTLALTDGGKDVVYKGQFIDAEGNTIIMADRDDEIKGYVLTESAESISQAGNDYVVNVYGKEMPIRLVVNFNEAGVYTGDRNQIEYKGEWVDAKVSGTMEKDEYLAVTENNDFYVFTAESGKWDNATEENAVNDWIVDGNELVKECSEEGLFGEGASISGTLDDKITVTGSSDLRMVFNSDGQFSVTTISDVEASYTNPDGTVVDGSIKAGATVMPVKYDGVEGTEDGTAVELKVIDGVFQLGSANDSIDVLFGEAQQPASTSGEKVKTSPKELSEGDTMGVMTPVYDEDGNHIGTSISGNGNKSAQVSISNGMVVAECIGAEYWQGSRIYVSGKEGENLKEQEVVEGTLVIAGQDSDGRIIYAAKEGENAVTELRTTTMSDEISTFNEGDAFRMLPEGAEWVAEGESYRVKESESVLRTEYNDKGVTSAEMEIAIYYGTDLKPYLGSEFEGRTAYSDGKIIISYQTEVNNEGYSVISTDSEGKYVPTKTEYESIEAGKIIAELDDHMYMDIITLDGENMSRSFVLYGSDGKKIEAVETVRQDRNGNDVFVSDENVYLIDKTQGTMSVLDNESQAIVDIKDDKNKAIETRIYENTEAGVRCTREVGGEVEAVIEYRDKVLYIGDNLENVAAATIYGQSAGMIDSDGKLNFNVSDENTTYLVTDNGIYSFVNKEGIFSAGAAENLPRHIVNGDIVYELGYEAGEEGNVIPGINRMYGNVSQDKNNPEWKAGRLQVDALGNRYFNTESNFVELGFMYKMKGNDIQGEAQNSISNWAVLKEGDNVMYCDWNNTDGYNFNGVTPDGKKQMDQTVAWNMPNGESITLSLKVGKNGNVELDSPDFKDENGELEFHCGKFAGYDEGELEFGITSINFDNKNGVFNVNATLRLSGGQYLDDMTFEIKEGGKGTPDEPEKESDTKHRLEADIDNGYIRLEATEGNSGEFDISFKLSDALEDDIGNVTFVKFHAGTELTVLGGSTYKSGDREYKLKTTNIDATVKFTDGKVVFLEDTSIFLNTDTNMDQLTDKLGDKDNLISGSLEITEKVTIEHADGRKEEGTRVQIITVDDKVSEIYAGKDSAGNDRYVEDINKIFNMDTKLTLTIDGKDTEIKDGRLETAVGECINFNGRGAEIDKNFLKAGYDAVKDVAKAGAGFVIKTGAALVSAAEVTGAWLGAGKEAAMDAYNSGWGATSDEVGDNLMEDSKTGRVLNKVGIVGRDVVYDVAEFALGSYQGVVGGILGDADMMESSEKLYEDSVTDDILRNIGENLAGSAVFLAGMGAAAVQWIADGVLFGLYDRDENSAGFKSMMYGINLICGTDHDEMTDVSNKELLVSLGWTVFNAVTLGAMGLGGKGVANATMQGLEKVSRIPTIGRGAFMQGAKDAAWGLVQRLTSMGNFFRVTKTGQMLAKTGNILGNIGKVEGTRIVGGTYLDMVAFDESYDDFGDWADKKTYEVFSSLADGEFSEALLGALNWALDDLMVASGLRILGKSS